MSLYNSQNNTVNIPHQVITVDQSAFDQHHGFHEDVPVYVPSDSDDHDSDEDYLPTIHDVKTYKNNIVVGEYVYSKIEAKTGYQPHQIFQLNVYLCHREFRPREWYAPPSNSHELRQIKSFVPIRYRPGDYQEYHSVKKVVNINKNILKAKPHSLISNFFYRIHSNTDVKTHPKYNWLTQKRYAIATYRNDSRCPSYEFIYQDRINLYSMSHSISHHMTIPGDSDEEDGPEEEHHLSETVNRFMQVQGKALPIRAAFHSTFKYVGLHSLKALCLTAICSSSDTPIKDNVRSLRLLAIRGDLPMDIVTDLSEYAVCYMCSRHPVPPTGVHSSLPHHIVNAYGAQEDISNSDKHSEYICIPCMSKKYIHIDYGEAKNISSCVTNDEKDRDWET